MFSPQNSNAQGKELAGVVLLDTTKHYTPLVLRITNGRDDVRSIKVHSSSRIVRAVPKLENLTIRVISESEIEIFLGRPDSARNFPNLSSSPIVEMGTDSASFEPNFSVSFLNANSQSISVTATKITFPANIRSYLADQCSSNLLNMSTGYDQSINGMLPVGSVDSKWRLVGTNVPQTQPFIGAGSGGERYFSLTSSGSGWLTLGSHRLYKEFCTTSEILANYQFRLSAYVYPGITCQIQLLLNNQTIWSSSVGGSYYGFQTPWFTGNKMLTNGTNRLEIVISSTSQQGYIGSGGLLVALNGSISNSSSASEGLSFKSPVCCELGSISGYKYWDMNCNGIKDNGEQGIAGWTVNLIPQAGPPRTTLTDALGFYSFADVSPYTPYTLAEDGQMGWIPSGSAGPYQIVLQPNQSAQRDFLNCKAPSCENLFHESGSNGSCCQYDFSLSNGIGPIKRIEYAITDGQATFAQSSGCNFIPATIQGTTSGSLVYGTPCNQNVDVTFGATSTSASGIVKVMFTFVYDVNGSEVSCDTLISFACDRMPLTCPVEIAVDADAFDPTNVDYRTFTISNSKIPQSEISSVDIKFVAESVPHHTGGGLKVDGLSRAWGFTSSGGPTDPYTIVRLGCDGVPAPNGHGLSATQDVSLNLGVDATIDPPYTGLVEFKVGYCDGDTCIYSYQWDPALPDVNAAVLNELEAPVDLHNLRISVGRVEGASSVSIELDTLATIVAGTLPSLREGGKLEGLSAYSERSRLLLRASGVHQVSQVDSTIIDVIYTLDSKFAGDQVPVTLRYYDKNGRKIATASKTVKVVKIKADIDRPRITSSKGIGSIEPNPAVDQISIRYDVRGISPVTFQIFDATGKSVAIWTETHSDAVPFFTQRDVRGLPSGVYVLQLTSEGFSDSQKFVITR